MLFVVGVLCSLLVSYWVSLVLCFLFVCVGVVNIYCDLVVMNFYGVISWLVVRLLVISGCGVIVMFSLVSVVFSR